MDRCQNTALWMDQAESGAAAPPAIRAHLAECASCRRRADLHDEAVSRFRQATDGPAVVMPALAVIRRAPAEAARRRRRAFGAAGAMAAAALVVAVWAGWPGDRPPADGDGPSGQGERPALAGQILEASGGEVAITDPEIASVTLAAGTRLSVGAWGEDLSRLHLERGQIEADVRHREPGQVFEIRTDLAVIRVVGTRFVVSCVPGVRTVVTGIEGVVQVDSVDGTAVGRVTAGLTLRVVAAVDGGAKGEGSGPLGIVTSVEDAASPASQARPAIGAPGRTLRPLVAMRTSSPGAAAEDRAGAASIPIAAEVPTPEEVLARALALLSRGADREAVDVLNAALPGAGVHRPRLLALLGDAHRVAGRQNDARTAYEEALLAEDGAVGEGVLVDLAALLQADLRRPEAAAGAWRRYLEVHPRGRYASRALWELSRIAEDAGRSEEALATWRRLVLEAPGAEEAPRAFVRAGRALIERGDLPAAEAWFADRAREDGTAYAEAALVGLMRTRLAQGRGDDVRSLAADHARRFPTGERRGEVQAILDAAGQRLQ